MKSRFILLSLLALLAAGQTALAETVTYTISGSSENNGNVNFVVTASGDASGTGSDTWTYASTQSRSNIALPGDIKLSFGSDKTSSLAVAKECLVISATGTTGGYITLSHGSKYIYHVTLKGPDDSIRQEEWNMTKSYTYRFESLTVHTIVVEYADKIPITDAVISGLNASYPVSNSAVTPTPTVTWHGTALTKDTHYTLSYQNNTTAGTATVKAAGKGIFSTSTNVSQNFTLVWATYTVRFNKNSDSAEGTMSNQAFYYTEEKALTANAFSRTGYTFDGWSTTANGAVVYTDGQSVSNLTATNGAIVDLYAQWSGNSYTLRLHHNDGTDDYTDMAMTYDVAANIQSISRTGYTLAGWSTTPDGAVAYTDGQSVVNLTATNGAIVDLYAQWTPITYNVRFNKNSDDASGTMANQAFTYSTAQALTANAFTRIGYTFDGWSTTANGAVAYTDGQSVSNLTATGGAVFDLYAQWTVNSYTVTLDNQGATTAGTTEVTASFDAAMPAIIVPAKTDHFFGGYFTEANGGGTKYYNADGTSAHIWDIASSTTLYAQWTYLPAVAFIDENGVEQTCSYYTTIESSSGQTFGDDNNEEAWYVVSDNVTVEGALEFKDKAVHLILCDGATLTVSGDDDKGMSHTKIGGLHIYGQRSDTGSLKFTNKNDCGIMGNHVTINGGTITATGPRDGINASYLTINGGTVTATDTQDGIYASFLTINGGTVTTTGTQDGIYARSSLTINGGTVTATANTDNYQSGINSDKDVTINGGTVSATGDIGINAHRTATINGGKVLATGQKYGITCTNNDGNMTIKGGNVIVTGDVRGINVPSGPITLGWTNVSDYITASSYACGRVFSVIGNQAFIDDEGHVYSGQLDYDAIVDKTLRPYLSGGTAITLVQGTKDGVTAWWGTFCNSTHYFVLSEGAAAYTMGSDNKLYRLGADGRTIPKNTAVVIIASESTIQMYNIGSKGIVVPDHAPGGNQLQGSNSAVDVSGLSGTPYVLSVDGNGVIGFREYTGTKIPANKAYYVE